MIDELQEKYGFKIENLNPVEKETFFKMLEGVEKSAITVEKMRDYITAMRDAVEQQIVKEKAFIRIFIFKFENHNLIRLQARLQNYMLLESFLMTPKRARQMMEDSIANLAKNLSS
jgi:hypothetical protein